MFLDGLLSLILKNQFATFNDIIYTIIHGLSTGQHATVVMANIYLHWHDLHLKSRLSRGMIEHFRYIDDGLMAVDCSISDAEVLAAINSWNSHIQADGVSSGATVVFLDLSLNLVSEGGGLRICYSTYRKHQNIYSYVPANTWSPPFHI